MAYWLFKTEPGCFSLDDLRKSPKQTTAWDGVRKFQARNFMRAMQVGDGGFLYHSGKEPAIVAEVSVVRAAYPDHTALDPANPHFDPQSTPAHNRWSMVDVRLVRALGPIPLAELRQEPELGGMELLRKGSRLSVQPVTEAEYQHIIATFGT